MAELALLGVSHHTAPLDVRERVALDPEQAGALARLLAGADGEAVCLSTCNRTELYVAGPDAARRAAEALESQVGSRLYSRLDADAAHHLFRVASGLDSLVRGEPEILGQVRTAYAVGAPGPLLDRLFREALRVGREVRARTSFGGTAGSVAAAAALLAERVLGDLSGRSVLVVGAGQVGSQAARRLAAHGARIAYVAGRSEQRRARLAARVGAQAVALAALEQALGAVDICVCSTSSPEFVLGRGQVERALAARERRPLLVIDLAVPRDVDPGVGELAYAFVYDIDDLDAAVGAGPARDATQEAEVFVAGEADRFRAWQASRGVVPAIAALRARAETIRARELSRVGARLDGLSGEQRRAVETLTAQIVNKLLHDPTVRLKEAAAGPEGAAYADAVRHLFALDADSNRLARE